MLRPISALALAAGLLPATLAQVSTDFESGWDQTAWPIYAPDCNQGGAVTLDNTVAHSGKNSLKVAGAGGYCGHIFFGTKSIPAGDVYVKTWIRADKALTADHVTFIAMDDASQAAGKHLRIGGQSEILMYNRESDDATLPDLSPQGIAASAKLTPNTWQCFEYHLGPNGVFETWLDGQAIAALTVKPGVTNANAGQWTRSTYNPKITSINFGWESYGGATNTFWYDDISISATRVGCGAAAGGSSPAPAPAPTSSRPSTLSTTVRPATTSSAAPTTAPSPSGCASPKYGQCGGQGWTGCTACAAGSTCTANGVYYSQCL
ncbi:hypothetical protein B9Z65_3180 [Elsinoe australis]|uniref:CBM1 domain-containing protein n=1 Tax=Elsinoe australis TaxID=40998 RepID=A0A2P7ZUM9_9PEZI|nr:hypothetical protein B9Z65_3180 [Elsinoe australis]